MRGDIPPSLEHGRPSFVRASLSVSARSEIRFQCHVPAVPQVPKGLPRAAKHTRRKAPPFQRECLDTYLTLGTSLYKMSTRAHRSIITRSISGYAPLLSKFYIARVVELES